MIKFLKNLSTFLIGIICTLSFSYIVQANEWNIDKTQYDNWHIYSTQENYYGISPANAVMPVQPFNITVYGGVARVISPIPSNTNVTSAIPGTLLTFTREYRPNYNFIGWQLGAPFNLTLRTPYAVTLSMPAQNFYITGLFERIPQGNLIFIDHFTGEELLRQQRNFAPIPQVWFAPMVTNINGTNFNFVRVDEELSKGVVTQSLNIIMINPVNEQVEIFLRVARQETGNVVFLQNGMEIYRTQIDFPLRPQTWIAPITRIINGVGFVFMNVDETLSTGVASHSGTVINLSPPENGQFEIFINVFSVTITAMPTS
ncbi:MAG: hypothetical protein FWF50_01960 [Defluviitaleaceae bacterium]|nr:hypothetical protein [Defluviitaleaceae bacterium]